MGLIVRSVEGWNLCRTGFLAGSSRYKKFSALPDFHNIFSPFLQTIDYSSPRGGISVETNTSGNIPTSYLLIDSVAPSDSGKYTCRPANAGEISVNVHIQDGKYLLNSEAKSSFKSDSKSYSSFFKSLLIINCRLDQKMRLSSHSSMA